MSSIAADILVGIAIFALGIAITMRRFARQEYLVLTVAALATPILAVFSVFYVLYAMVTNKKIIDPCPLGFEEAEKIVEHRRQQMFGGPAREPSMTRDWKLAYQFELQRETDRVQRVARRYLIPA